ncbi:MAG: sugar phosphate isomerase/epimerase [Clostridia bacterium]|nr:sugar phosphate isomerase/epimerase [Clostridia bacterium]
MIFGNAAWGFRETPLEKQFEITAEMGLSVLEAGIANAPGDIQIGDDAGRVQSLCEKYGVSVECAATGNDFTNGQRDDVDKVKNVIDMCEALGVKYLRIFAGFSPKASVYGARWDNMVRCLNEVYDYAKRVTLTVETHGGVCEYDDGVEHFESVTTNIDALSALIEDVPKIRFNFDAANLCAAGSDYEKVYAVIRDRTEVFHLKDFTKLASGHIKPCACGEGSVRFDKFSDFNGIALFEYENTADIASGLKRSYEYMKELLR